MNELGNTPADKDYKPSGISKAEEAAQQYYDDNSICCSESLTIEIFIAGYEKAEQDITDKAKYSSGWDGFFYGKGYEQAEKDTIERAIAWLKENANKYIVDLTPTYPDAPANIIVGGMCWEHLKDYLQNE